MYQSIKVLAGRDGRMAGGDNGRRRVSGDETKNESSKFLTYFSMKKTGKIERCSRNKWTVKKIFAWVWRWNKKKK
ncbi:hypothetical protein ACSQ67_021334 [Phaseolus vulgaris]